MTFDLENCWDCPIPLSEVLAQYGLLVVILIVSAGMMGARRQFFRGLGWMATVLVLFWAAVFTWVVPTWGIIGAPRGRSWPILLGFDAALCLVGYASFRLVRWRLHSTADA